MALFLANDLTHPPESRVYMNIQESFSIGGFHGFTGNFSTPMLERLKRCPFVSQVSLDIEMRNFQYMVQRHAPTHLARLSQRAPLADGPQNYYFDAKSTGKGVNAYIIDTGINIDHPEFEGRAYFGKDFTGEGVGDSNGHGTHVAGLVGSRTFGSSKSVKIYDVKALDGMGVSTLSIVVAALEFSLKHMQRSGRLGVVNLSLGSDRNDIMNEAISAAMRLGLVVVAAAGNTQQNACLTSPASTEDIITVGSIDDLSDDLTWFTNYGPCVDVFASGNAVFSVNAFDTEQPMLLSGTSMSAPIVSGLVANLLSGGVQPRKVRGVILAISSKNRIDPHSLKEETPNRIAFNGVMSDADNYKGQVEREDFSEEEEGEQGYYDKEEDEVEE